MTAVAQITISTTATYADVLTAHLWHLAMIA